MNTDIPTHVLSGVPAEEVPMRAIPPLSGVVVLTWYDARWVAHGPFVNKAAAQEWIKGCNDKHRAALIVPVEWRAKP